MTLTLIDDRLAIELQQRLLTTLILITICQYIFRATIKCLSLI